MPRLFWTQRQDIGARSRGLHALAYDGARRRVVLFGGDAITAGGSRLNETWEWDGQNWTQMSDIGPAARVNSTLVFDSLRKRTVCFGGSDKQNFGDTWEWDGLDWTQMADSGPFARTGHLMVYDSDRNRVVLAAGHTGRTPIFDTWEWDGTDWTQVGDVGPVPRDFCGAAYDAVRHRTVLFGGLSHHGFDTTTHSDTWELDSGIWTQVSTLGPGPIRGHAMVYDGAQTILFNPADGSTWSWDGKHWTHRQEIGPGQRTTAALAHDGDRRRTVLFSGGLTPGLADTWELFEAAIQLPD